MIIDKERLEKVSDLPKRAYSAPKLTNYGSVSRLTQAGSFLGNDGNTKCTGNAGDPKQCS